MKTWHKIAASTIAVGTAFTAGTKLQPKQLDVLQDSLIKREQEYIKTHDRYEIVPPTLDPTTGATYQVDSIVEWDGHEKPKSISYKVLIIKTAVSATSTP